jgi:hypothetical protein
VEERRFQRRVKLQRIQPGFQRPHGNFRQFSIERLLRFLVALDHDVQIVVKPHHDRKNAPPCKSSDAGPGRRWEGHAF